MAKKAKNVASGFQGTYDCFPDPVENQGSNTNGGSISKARNSSDIKKKGDYNPLGGVGSAMDSVAENSFPPVPALGQSKMIDGDAMRKGKPSFGDGGGASYKKGLK